MSFLEIFSLIIRQTRSKRQHVMTEINGGVGSGQFIFLVSVIASVPIPVLVFLLLLVLIPSVKFTMLKYTSSKK